MKNIWNLRPEHWGETHSSCAPAAAPCHLSRVYLKSEVTWPAIRNLESWEQWSALTSNGICSLSVISYLFNTLCVLSCLILWMHDYSFVKRKILLKRLSDYCSHIVSKFWGWVVDSGLESTLSVILIRSLCRNLDRKRLNIPTKKTSISYFFGYICLVPSPPSRSVFSLITQC